MPMWIFISYFHNIIFIIRCLSSNCSSLFHHFYSFPSLKKHHFYRVHLQMLTIYDALPHLLPNGPIKSQFPMSMEDVNQSYGFILYRTNLNHLSLDSQAKQIVIKIDSVRDRSVIMVDQVWLILSGLFPYLCLAQFFLSKSSRPKTTTLHCKCAMCLITFPFLLQFLMEFLSISSIIKCIQHYNSYFDFL